MYKKVDSSMDFCSREKEIIDFWNENNAKKNTTVSRILLFLTAHRLQMVNLI